MKTITEYAKRKGPFFVFFLSLLIFFWGGVHWVYATGPGTNTVSVSPSTTLVNSTGNILTFTYTAAGTMTGGSVAITAPSTWSVPQGTSGVAGYTTVSTNGTVGAVFDNADSLTGWATSSACSTGLTLNTTDATHIHSGTGSVKCVNNNNDGTGGKWYKNPSSALDWSSYSTIGFWIYTDTAITNGRLAFEYASDQNLNTLVETRLSLGRDVPANTWTYVSFSFASASSARTAVRSYGFEITNASVKNSTIYTDDFAIGSGSTIIPGFLGNTISVNAISLTTGQTITFTYGAGGGASGAVAPSAPETSTFSTASTADNSTATSTIASSPTVSVVDTTAPSVTLTAPSTSSTIHGNSVSLTATASDNVSVAGVKFYIGTTLIGAEDTSAPYTGTLDSTSKTDGSYTIIAVARDSSTNYATSTGAIVTIDNTGPVVSSIASTTAATTATVTWTTDESSNSKVFYGMVASTYTTSTSSTSLVTNHSVGLTGLSATTRYYYVVVSTDASGNTSTSTEKSLLTATPDTTPPTLSSVSIASNNASTTLAKVGDTITLSFSASETISSPTVSFTSSGNAVAGSVTVSNPSGNNWTATYVTNSGDTTGVIAFNISSFNDSVGNNGSTVTSGSGSVTLDKTAPTVTLTSSASATTGTSPIPVTATFNEGVTGFSVDDITVGNGMPQNVSGSGTTYTFDVVPTANGVVTVDIGSGATQDAAGNGSSAATQLTRTFSSSRPTVSLTTTASSTTKLSPVHVTVTFSVSVDGFDATDLSGQVTNGTAGNFTGTGSTYTFDITPSGQGTVAVTLPAGVAVDTATGVNQNFASPQVSVVYDSVTPTVTEVTPVATPTNDPTPNYTFNTTETGMITYSGGCSSVTSSAVSGNNTITFSTLSDGNHSCTLTVTDAALNVSSTLHISAFTTDTAAPAISDISANPSSVGATLRWTTNEAASSQLIYGLTSSYGSASAETDTSSRVTSHQITLSNLVSCSTYHYTASSSDAAGNSSSAGDTTFTTRGCAGNASVKSQSSHSITHSAGGSTSLISSGTGLSIAVPASFGSNDAQFQIKRLDQTEALDTTTGLGTPAGVQSAGDYVFDLHALTDVETAQSSFNVSLAITLYYTAADIVGLNESTLKIYRNDSSVWTQLSNCSVDTGARSVTCNTDHFSTFSIFGQTATVTSNPTVESAVVTTGGGSGIRTGCKDVLALNYNYFSSSTPGLCVYAAPKSTAIFTRNLTVGMKGIDVIELKKILISKNSGPAARTLAKQVMTNVFGSFTKNAVLEFQKAKGILPQSGMVGPKTRAWLIK